MNSIDINWLLAEPIVFWVGIGLVIWLLYDLFTGAVYLHREIERDSEPGLYWFSIVLWGAVAASCFIYE